MINRQWWAIAMQWGLWAVAMGIVMGWLARARAAAPRPQERGTLAHPRGILILGLVSGGFFLALAVLSAAFPGETGSPGISLVFLGLSLLGVPLVLDYYNGRHTLTPDGLRYGRMFGGGGLLRWGEVRRLSYSETWKWFRLELADGRVVRISVMLRGLPEFAAAALVQVPSGAIEAGSRGVLEATAAGQLPSVWR